MEAAFYRDFFVFDYERQEVFLIQADVGGGIDDPKTVAAAFDNECSTIVGPYSVDSPVSCCTKEQYMDLVQRIIDYIKQGDIYEVNLSHRFSAAYQGDEYGIFTTLYAINPAPFSAYINLGDTVIVSNSPERFLRAHGRWVETRPIKGTISRSPDEAQDHANRMSLLDSSKDEAELAMIVDLLRNDLGKVCEYGSVHVKEHKRIEGFSNVWHLLSIVEGTLRPDEDYASLMRACFPGGSITGCPKIRSMEIIDELETYARNLYTGSIFVANEARFDSNIVIRTIVAKNKRLYFSVGGAVVYDSIPEGEYDETLAKAQSIMKALAGDRG
jgi:para-aminobenzoate synthetase component 1